MTRVLFLAPRDCRPPNTGTKLRNFYLCRELAQTAQVTYLCFEDEVQHGADAIETLAARVIAVPYDGSGSPLQLARGLVGPWPLTVLKYTTPAMRARLGALLREESFDLVLMQSLLMSAYLPLLKAARPRPMLVCDWHNVDSEVLERYAAHAPNQARKIYALATANRLRALERAQLPRFDAHLTVSDRDTEHLRVLAPESSISTLENGTETAGFAPGEAGGAQVRRFADRRGKKDRRQIQAALPAGEIERRVADRRQTARRNRALPHRILFVGSMDYYPNSDATLYFAHNTWPRLHEQRPDWVFTIVGRDPSPAVRDLAQIPGIEVTGTVPDVRPFYREAFASVVPLRVGGGSRLKILEAMAARVPIVSSTLGAEGLEVRDGQNILIRDEPAAMASALIDLATDIEARDALVERAHELVMARYDWSAIGARLRGLCDELLATKSALEEVPR